MEKLQELQEQQLQQQQKQEQEQEQQGQSGELNAAANPFTPGAASNANTGHGGGGMQQQQQQQHDYGSWANIIHPNDIQSGEGQLTGIWADDNDNQNDMWWNSDGKSS